MVVIALMAELSLQLNGAPLEAAGDLPEGAWVELSALPPPGAILELALGGAALEPFLRPGDPAWRWRWQAPAAAGAYALSLCARWPDDRAEQLRASLHVAPRKLDQERYALLLEDLQRLGRALVFALSGGSLDAAPVPDAAPPTPAEELHGLFGAELDRLEAAVARLARRPPERTRAAPGLVEPGRLRDFSALGRLVPHPADSAPARGKGASADDPPERDPAAIAAGLGALPEPGGAPSYDSYEARLLRRLLAELARRLTRLEGRLERQPALTARLTQARARLAALLALPFLADVPPLDEYRGPTQRLRRNPDYRVVYQLWRRLRQRPLLSWDTATLSLPVADLPRLYERWCAARVALALTALAGWAVAEQALLAETAGDWLLALPEDRPLLHLERPDGARLSLRYHARYTPAGTPLGSLDRHTRVPDLAIELVRPGAAPVVLVLDAKYRLDASGGVPEDALADAYSYLGAIGGAGGARATLGAALLYPGAGGAHTYASGVAALPLLPGEDAGALEAWLSVALG